MRCIYAVYSVGSAYAVYLQRLQPLGCAQPAVHLVVEGVDGSAVRTAVELQHGTPQPLDLAAARLHREQAVSNAKHPGPQTDQHSASLEISEYTRQPRHECVAALGPAQSMSLTVNFSIFIYTPSCEGTLAGLAHPIGCQAVRVSDVASLLE